MSDDGVDPIGIKALERLTREARQLLKIILDEPAKEAGRLISDRLKQVRLRNYVRFLQEARTLCLEAGVTPRPTNTKVLNDILMEGSLEDDQDLSHKWACLLASAITGSNVHPSYPRILAEMTASDARLVDFIASETITKEKRLNASEIDIPGNIFMTIEEAAISIQNLLRLSVIEHFGTHSFVGKGGKMKLHSSLDLKLTPLGLGFFSACQGPQAGKPTKALTKRR